MAILTNILQFVYGKTQKTRTNMRPLQKWGPFLCIFAAMFLMLADLTRHLVNDDWGTVCVEVPDDQSLGVLVNGKWGKLDTQFYEYCRSQQMLNEYTSSGALSVYGWVFAIGCTWSGVLLLFTGLCWALNLPGKFLARWRQIRATARRPNEERLVGAA